MNYVLLEKWTTQLKKGILELCILNTLSHSSQYGYDIVRSMRKYNDFLGTNEGTVYSILYRFKKDGLVDTRLEESTQGPIRKYYELTGFGKEYLVKTNKVWEDISLTIKDIKELKNK
jgi:PadR family transcriptional regulator PadR